VRGNGGMDWGWVPAAAATFCDQVGLLTWLPSSGQQLLQQDLLCPRPDVQ